MGCVCGACLVVESADGLRPVPLDLDTHITIHTSPVPLPLPPSLSLSVCVCVCGYHSALHRYLDAHPLTRRTPRVPNPASNTHTHTLQPMPPTPTTVAYRSTVAQLGGLMPILLSSVLSSSELNLRSISPVRDICRSHSRTMSAVTSTEVWGGSASSRQASMIDGVTPNLPHAHTDGERER